MLRIEELDSFSKLEDLRTIWNPILQRSEDNNIFSTLEWLSCWWKHFGNDRQLRILVAKEDDEILGIAPLMLSRYSFMHLGNMAKIEFIGSPDSDYNNFILLKKEKECLKLFLSYLMSQSDWDYLQLRDVHDESLSLRLLYEIRANQPWNLDFKVGTLCPYITLRNSFSELMNRLGPNMRANIRRQMRKLQKKYQVSIKTYTDFDSINKAMNTFFDLHQKRWTAKGEPGAFSSKIIRDFHIDIAKRFAEKNWLSLYFLAVDDKSIAAEYSFCYDQKVYYYLSGFDPKYENYSVGNLLRSHIIEVYIQKGFKEFDLMRGYGPYEHASYKANWANAVRKNYEVQLVRKGLFARIYGQIKRHDTLRAFMTKAGKPTIFRC
jgi:CelD/BcsL family acetyltransferase involved in cellulose biosynthesis